MKSLAYMALLVSIAGLGQAQVPNNLKPSVGKETPQQVYDRNEKNAKEVSQRKENEKSKSDIPAGNHQGRVPVGKGQSVGGTVEKGGATANYKRDLDPPKAATPEPKSAPAAKPAPAAPAPAPAPKPTPQVSRPERPLIERPGPADSHGGPREREAIDKAGRTA